MNKDIDSVYNNLSEITFKMYDLVKQLENIKEKYSVDYDINDTSFSIYNDCDNILDYVKKYMHKLDDEAEQLYNDYLKE